MQRYNVHRNGESHLVILADRMETNGDNVVFYAGAGYNREEVASFYLPNIQGVRLQPIIKATETENTKEENTCH